MKGTGRPAGPARLCPLALACIVALQAHVATAAILRTLPPVALVVGNSSYEHLGGEPSGAGDAEAVASALVGLGFEVTKGVNLRRAEFIALVDEFHARTAGREAALFYYSGFSGRRQVFAADRALDGLAPVDAPVGPESHLHLLDTKDIVAGMAGDVNLVFLEKFMSAGAGESCTRYCASSIQRPNTLVAHAGNMPAAGAMAGAFTAALLEGMVPFADIVDVVQEAFRTMAAEGERRQWMESSLHRPYLLPSPARLVAHKLDSKLVTLVDLFYLHGLQAATEAAPAHGAEIEDGAVYVQVIAKSKDDVAAVRELIEAGGGSVLWAFDFENDVFAFENEVYAWLPLQAIATLARSSKVYGVNLPEPLEVFPDVSEAEAVLGEESGLTPATVGQDELRRSWVPGLVFKERLHGGGEGPAMVVVAGGWFRLGCLPGDDACLHDEMFEHDAAIGSSFALSVHEVTVGQFQRFAEATGHAAGECQLFDGEIGSWRSPGFPQTRDHPVTCVSWEDARAYARWLSGETGETYRLPSEWEWEYAARSGASTRYSFGNDESALCRHGNHADSGTDFGWRNRSCSDGVGWGTAPAGSYEANGFGLHDMHGNVWEWVEDCWNRRYLGAPADGTAWVAGNCSPGVRRGGSWRSSPGDLRAANRDYASGRYEDDGFRLARTLAP